MSTVIEAETPVVLKAPFPWFGGKSRIAAQVWERFGECRNYVEPFLGSAAMLLAAPRVANTETVNDKDGMLANFWRAVQMNADAVAHWADWPVNENDLHARHYWLTWQRADITRKLEGNPDYYDAKIAGWWVWGLCAWIGSGWCESNGPWAVVDGELVKDSDGVKRQLPHLGNAGMGACDDRSESLQDTMRALSDRFRNVRVCCGDWQRVCGPTPTEKNGLTAVFLDPPYAATTGRDMNLYAEESHTVAHDVLAWCVANGDNPKMRIALCGYDEHDELAAHGWSKLSWTARGGYGCQKAEGDTNRKRETVWFSPHCIPLADSTPTDAFL